MALHIYNVVIKLLLIVFQTAWYWLKLTAYLVLPGCDPDACHGKCMLYRDMATITIVLLLQYRSGVSTRVFAPLPSCLNGKAKHDVVLAGSRSRVWKTKQHLRN